MALTEEHLIPHPGVQSRWVRLANGARCHYMTGGDTGPAVILLHGGINGSSGMAGWGRWMIPHLAKEGFRVYAPDQPAFGLADTREEYWPRYGTLSHVEFVKDFADALCIDRFHLSGNSMGATNTAHFVCAYPERVISFILIATYLQGELGVDTDGTWRKRFGGLELEPWDGTPDGMRKLMAKIIMHPEGITQDLCDMRAYMGNLQADVYKDFMAARQRILDDPSLKQRWMLKGRLDQIGIPGIYLYGMEDVLIPVAAGYEQEDLLPNIKFYYPENTGHQGQTDTPDLHNRVYAEFFKTGNLSPELEKEAGVSERRAAPAG